MEGRFIGEHKRPPYIESLARFFGTEPRTDAVRMDFVLTVNGGSKVML